MYDDDLMMIVDNITILHCTKIHKRYKKFQFRFFSELLLQRKILVYVLPPPFFLLFPRIVRELRNKMDQHNKGERGKYLNHIHIS